MDARTPREQHRRPECRGDMVPGGTCGAHGEGDCSTGAQSTAAYREGWVCSSPLRTARPCTMHRMCSSRVVSAGTFHTVRGGMSADSGGSHSLAERRMAGCTGDSFPGSSGRCTCASRSCAFVGNASRTEKGRSTAFPSCSSCSDTSFSTHTTHNTTETKFLNKDKHELGGRSTMIYYHFFLQPTQCTADTRQNGTPQGSGGRTAAPSHTCHHSSG